MFSTKNTTKLLTLITIFICMITQTACNNKYVSSRPVNKVDFKGWAKTPPMGWNSWDCYGPTVRENEVKANADYMAEHLKAFGWEYVVVDIRWFVENTKSHGYNQKDPRYVVDTFGRYMPAQNKFPSATNGVGFKPLADYIHSKGLKFGIHIMRGIPKYAVDNKLPIKDANGITADQIYTTENRCEWLKDNYTIMADKPSAQAYYNSLFQLYASWGVDFIKVDDLSAPIYHEKEIALIRKAINSCGRKIVFSTSPGQTPIEAANHVSAHANMWRMVNDVWDKWEHIDRLMNTCQPWMPYIKPGTWPDCDMIPLGKLSIRGEVGDPRMTNLTKDEQYTLMSLFSIVRSPLMFGGDLPSMDSFTHSLLTNKEVLKMHSESTHIRPLPSGNNQLIITSDHQDQKIKYFAIFNRSSTSPQSIQVNLKDLNINLSAVITEMWSGRKLGNFESKFIQTLKPHACGLYKIEVK